MKQIELKLSEYEIIKVLSKNFNKRNGAKLITINKDIRPYFSRLIFLSESTIRRAIRNLKKLEVIKYDVSNFQWYHMSKGKNYNNVIKQVTYE